MDLEKKLKHYRISPQEYQKICDLLGRAPEGLEWPLFSALWSEHCSYKTSKIHLKKFYSKNKYVLDAEGENAGVIDLGQGERVAFKMESHNHPSFISPHQGAATGVGGILRDIFTMGARPVALANYLCFGESKTQMMPHLVDGVVRGIGDYGNCVGVPTITGHTEFHKSYNKNILVNAFALGLFRPGDNVHLSRAKGFGYPVVYVGAKTGKDGVHGASMASESFDNESELKKPTVQIGDPFFEKLLIESCLEVMSLGLVESIQDMGAAGLVSSSFEMASKGNVGLSLHLDRVPVRDQNIQPEEILLSESQERMLLICKPENLEKLRSVFKRWDLEAVAIGEVLESREIHLYWNSKLMTAIDPHILVEQAPVYQREYSSWSDKNRLNSSNDFWKVKGGTDFLNLSYARRLELLLSLLPLVEKSWIYQQYDQRVGASTVLDCSEPLGAIHLQDSDRCLSVALGCRPHMMRWDAWQGGLDAVFYPSLQLIVKGFQPMAVTDCLNFGNPEKPEVMTEFVASVESISEACFSLDTPVISGNVSFYNETEGENITSTPATGVVGLRPNALNIPSSYFEKADCEVYLLSDVHLICGGVLEESFSSSGSAQSNMQGIGSLNSENLSRWFLSLKDFIIKHQPSSTRVVGRGGVHLSLLKMSRNGVGVSLEPSLKADDELWLERCYEVIFVFDGQLGVKQSLELKDWAQSQKLKCQLLGRTVLGRIGYKGEEAELTGFNAIYQNSWRKHFETLE